MNILHKTNVKDFFERAIRNTKLDIQRETLLENIANKIAKTILKKGEVNINFICTHNSRRSQFAQIWAYFAMEYYGINNGFSFSSGTSATTFYTSTLKALEESGFKFSLEEFSHKNPKYIINYNGAKKEILGYSKVVEDPINKTPFIAITTCGNADENCPVILEVSARFHLPYKDPKWSDDEDNEKEIYLNTSKIIAGEMGILFKKVKEQLLS
ncbi:low molecular weight phosphatase family protein [Wenyingzhuangia marina]|uniref:Arsenate reductase n=1 Tax=Wenyingzhuangia marina TaxID=1195760 RepID=A0A1M5WRB8_9FLAO|nr:hypothetical protein [Wenyingzhuangia marina]GGF79961.1 hypothetical protein GCM10011397_23700 [Wenyingzhuangia marina]SHH89694.1 arsenate reductase [Wenyingzhuangia marina]